jgi:hypothetical protein
MSCGSKHHNRSWRFIAEAGIYFGLGATMIDRVEVDWPSRQKQVVTSGLQENRTLQITEPK